MYVLMGFIRRMSDYPVWKTSEYNVNARNLENIIT